VQLLVSPVQILVNLQQHQLWHFAEHLFTQRVVVLIALYRVYESFPCLAINTEVNRKVKSCELLCIKSIDSVEHLVKLCF
jgi:hypothetical protein